MIVKIHHYYYHDDDDDDGKEAILRNAHLKTHDKKRYILLETQAQPFKYRWIQEAGPEGKRRLAR